MRPVSVELKPRQVIDRYELLAPIATRATSRVWAARRRGSRGLESLVALKTILCSGPEAEHLGQRFWAEARLASRVPHPNVVRHLDIFERAGVPCAVMEWIDGEPLSALLDPAINRGGLPLGLAVQIVVQTCKAMQAIHSLRGPDGRPLELVHAELAPRHLMIDASGTVKCIDLGRASGSRSDLRPDPRADVSLLAPERELGRALDSRADVFSLGALLYLLTTGKHPDRQGPSIVRPSAVSENYPMGLEWVVLQALARQPEQRFQSAGEMLDELVAALPGHASEIELATYVQNVCASSFAHRRNIVHGSLRRSLEESAERIPLADRTSEPSPNTLSPAVLESSQPLSPTLDWKPLPLALAAAATTFVAGFTWTLVGTGMHTPPTSKPSAAQQAPSAGKPLASAPTSPELLPRSAPILQAPAETTSSAPALPSTQPPSAPKKPKPAAPRQRYGI